MGACLWPTSFPEHPFPDIRRTVQHRDALRLTRVEKANTFDIHETHLLQVQNYAWSATVDLRLQFLQMLRSYSSNQPDRRGRPIGNSFDSQGHFRAVSRCALQMIAITAPWVTRMDCWCLRIAACRFFSVCSAFGIRRRRRIRFRKLLRKWACRINRNGREKPMGVGGDLCYQRGGDQEVLKLCRLMPSFRIFDS